MPSRVQKKYSQSLHATDTGISSSMMGHVARLQTLPTYLIVKKRIVLLIQQSRTVEKCSKQLAATVTKSKGWQMTHQMKE